jgi:hypothetical protein
MSLRPISETDAYYEIFEQLKGTPLAALVACGIFDRERIEVEARRLQGGKTFNLERFITDVSIEGAVLEANELLSLRNKADLQEQKISSILDICKRIARFWPAIWLGCAAGLLSNILFVIIVFFGWWTFQTDPSPFALLKHVFNLK